MQYYWAATLLMLMGGVGMTLDPRDVISRWAKGQRGYWLRVMLAAFILPPAMAVALDAVLPLPPGIRGGVLLMSVAPGAPMLTRMVSKRGRVFDPGLAASYQIAAGLLVPVLTPWLLHILGRFYHRDVWVSPWILAWQVAGMQFLPLVAGLLIKHYRPGFAERAEPWLSRVGNLLLVSYLILILFGMRRMLEAVGLLAAVTALAFALCCLVAGHLLAGPTIALSNTNRHVGLAMLVAALNFKDRLQAIAPFFAAYLFLAPVVMLCYAMWQRRRAGGAMALS